MDRPLICRNIRFLVLGLMSTGSFLLYLLNDHFALMSYPKDFIIETNFEDECLNSYQLFPTIFRSPIVNDSSQFVDFINTRYTRAEVETMRRVYNYGMMSSQMLSALLCLKCEAQNIVAYSAFISSVLNFFSSAHIKMRKWEYVVIRFLVAFSTTFMLPAFFTIISKWAPPYERTFFVLGIIIAFQFGFIILKPLVYVIGTLLTKEAWYALLSCLMFAWALIWLCIVRSSPRDVTWITTSEVLYITQKQEIQGYHQQVRVNCQWKQMFYCSAFWSLLIATLANQWNYVLFYTEYYPFLLIRVLGSDIIYTGSILGFSSNILFILGSITFTSIEYRLLKSNSISLTFSRKLLSAPGFVIPGVFILITISNSCHFPISLFLIWTSLFCNGAIVSSVYANTIDLAPNYSGIIFAIVNTINAMVNLFIPVIYNEIVGRDNIIDNWRHLLIYGATLYLSAGLIAMWMTSSEVQSWAEPVQQVLVSWPRKPQRLQPELMKTLSDIIEESESKVTVISDTKRESI